MRRQSIHKYRGFTIVPDSRGWALTWKRVVVPPMLEVRLFGAAVEEQLKVAFFPRLALAREFVDRLIADDGAEVQS